MDAGKDEPVFLYDDYDSELACFVQVVDVENKEKRQDANWARFPGIPACSYLPSPQALN